MSQEPISGHAALDERTDVYVSGGLTPIIIEVSRGDRISQARMFGLDFEGPIHTAMHDTVYAPTSAGETAPDHQPCAPAPAARPSFMLRLAAALERMARKLEKGGKNGRP